MASKRLLFAAGIVALVPSYIILSDCEASDALQTFALVVPPAVATLCFGAIGWLWPVGATTLQRLGVAVFCAAFLGGLAWYSVVVVFVGCGT